MKITTVFYALMFCGLCLVSDKAQAQSSTGFSKAENDRIDSLKKSYDADEQRSQRLRDKDNLSDLKAERSDTKQKAREARSVEREANDAARQSRNAYKAEKKAQTLRKQADKQAKKAEKARRVSDSN